MLDAMESYNSTWNDLNADLRHTELTQGLGKAIAALEDNQRQTGFIKDFMFDVERFVFRHPDHPALFFRVQFNAKRLERFNGAGVTAPPPGTEVAHGGCFLCRDNVRWQQQGAELGYALDVGGNPYHAWMNPFPLMPGHVVIASANHETQDWAYRTGEGQSMARLTRDLTALAVRMPGYVGFYNGVDAGASIPGHLHYQFFRRPLEHPVFPLEARIQDRCPDGDAPIIVSDYPLAVVKWQGPVEAVAGAATAWFDDWAARNAERLYRMTSNIIVSSDDGETVSLMFVPRDQAKTRGEGMSGLVGGLEVLGEIVMSSVEERRRLDAGEIDYFTIEHMLCGVRTPLFTDA